MKSFYVRNISEIYLASSFGSAGMTTSFKCPDPGSNMAGLDTTPHDTPQIIALVPLAFSWFTAPTCSSVFLSYSYVNNYIIIIKKKLTKKKLFS